MPSVVSRANYSGGESAPRHETAAFPRAITVPGELAGLRFDQALARLVPQHSRSRLKDWIDAGRVTLDGAIAAGKRRLAGGERIAIAAAQDSLAVADAPLALRLAIVHGDEAIVVAANPPGLIAPPGSGHRD